MSKLLQKLDWLGLLLLVAAALYYSVAGIWDRWAISLFVMGAITIAVGLVANYKQILQTLGKRSTKYFTNYVVSVLLVLALVAGLNFFGQRHARRFDMTASGRYTLAPQTTQILGKLTKDLEIKAFFPGATHPPLKELLTQYRGASRQVRFEFLDAEKSPELARQYEVKSYGTYQNILTGSQLKFGTVVLLYGDRKEKIEKKQQEVSEEDLTNAIIKVQRTETKKIYFVQGHGEKDPADTEREGYAVAKQALENQSFAVDTLNVAAKNEIPPDAKVLILGGPTAEPMPEQIQLMTGFLNRGGGMLVMVDPAPAASLSAFLAAWGVAPDNDLIVSPAGYVRTPAWPAVTRAEYETSPITEGFRLNSFFPEARSVQPAKASVDGVTVSTLFKSMPNSWGKTDLKNTAMAFNEKTDLKGPLPLALTVTKDIKPADDKLPATKARMVVVGNSSFAANNFIQGEGNANLFLNMVSWLASEEDLISVRPKAPEDRKVILSQGQEKMIQWLCLLVLPGAALVSGIVVWTRRRR
jgi:ABC-type uncharacterized transport system involved in gliding motility auxiliary subunit